MKKSRATCITRWAILAALLPLVVGLPYAIGWAVRPTEWLNTTFGLPYACAALMLFSIALILGIVSAVAAGRITGGLLLLLGIQTCNAVLGIWLLFAGPGQSISVYR
ncbi:MAG: hypothetical protein HN742_07745 [Lentisphaerae bacterium]|nr:hypothetical protein [Lentisphaerota bacterium]MBT4818884.1 hypothetical protein [Lentisphaerota bacterium]MBT5608620.1 hypothetical protein [Lentisphaerota bacterium]MBT7055851.1 hypothetical protein [Lentisphaerota bacterium]MBT7841749.1 hypothetical protein [Lentisphaerota bacterium]